MFIFISVFSWLGNKMGFRKQKLILLYFSTPTSHNDLLRAMSLQTRLARYQWSHFLSSPWFIMIFYCPCRSNLCVFDGDTDLVIIQISLEMFYLCLLQRCPAFLQSEPTSPHLASLAESCHIWQHKKPKWYTDGVKDIRLQDNTHCTFKILYVLL